MVVMEEAVVEGAAASEDVNPHRADERPRPILRHAGASVPRRWICRRCASCRRCAFPRPRAMRPPMRATTSCTTDYLKRAWDDSVTELAIDYVSTFIGHGVNGYSAAHPYESVYTSERRLLMQEARAEVLATLRENELKRGSWNEAEDHIALELEFMQRMALRAAEALSDNAEDEAIAFTCARQSYDFLRITC